MLDINQYFCVNESCIHYGLRGQGNVVKAGTYGKHQRQLLQCQTCKKRFSETRNTAFFGSKYPPQTIQRIIRCVAEGNGVRATAYILELDKDAVNRVIYKAGNHCVHILTNLIHSLHLEECQMDELWAFIQKKRLFQRKTLKKDTDENGYGQPLIRSPS
jgi:transposase-like protein